MDKKCGNQESRAHRNALPLQRTAERRLVKCCCDQLNMHLLRSTGKEKEVGGGGGGGDSVRE